MPTITFDASNELPPLQRATLVGVSGEGFTPFTQVNIGVFVAANHAVAQALALVGADGAFAWGSTVSPKCACGSELTAYVHDADSTEFSASAAVFCP